MRNYPLLFLMGPTAIGKTACAIGLAKCVEGEIINVDSAQIFQQMEVGTAKPTDAELAEVPHHLVGVIDPALSYSAARFCDDALAAIADIRSRGRTPVLAGGTMLYFNALEQGLAELPEADETVRARLLSEAQAIGWPGMHNKLSAVDPVAAKRIHPNDPQRTQRALEVYELTGTTLTEWQANTHSRLPEPVCKFSLMPAERHWLHARIEKRFLAMLDNDFLLEVERLRHNPRLHAQLPSMRSVGYRQAWQHLDGESTYDEFVQQGLAASRQLAKRQMTWIRGMKNVHTITCDDENNTPRQVQAVMDLLSAENSEEIETP
jgi:tRNA dimethylallyltransferase